MPGTRQEALSVQKCQVMFWYSVDEFSPSCYNNLDLLTPLFKELATFIANQFPQKITVII